MDSHFSACVQPTECCNPAGADLQRDCMIHAERHAVIPFEGEEHWMSPKASDNWGAHSNVLKREDSLGNLLRLRRASSATRAHV